MAISAADVKRLRDETDAPMMDCKAALEESGGDFEMARQILREKGKAAAQKKAGRATGEGIAKYVASDDGKSVAGVVVECETDFVAKNDDFKTMVDKLARGFLAAGKAGGDVVIDGKTADEIIVDAVNIIRENIQLRYAEVSTTDGGFGVYNHHTGKTAAVVELHGDSKNLQAVGEQLGIQVVGLSPTFLKKEDVPQDVIEKEIEIQKNRAVEEGKDPKMAENIAKGRVNKEFYQHSVLMEQVFYADNKKNVSTYVAEEAKAGGGSLTVDKFVKIEVGQFGGDA
ncbi:MAG: translation elongation factor Ts [Fimbriimonadaceae bacterium]|nr:translation elongation factor Ts [Fimbriimonadaceae bacterium]